MARASRSKGRIKVFLHQQDPHSPSLHSASKILASLLVSLGEAIHVSHGIRLTSDKTWAEIKSLYRITPVLERPIPKLKPFNYLLFSYGEHYPEPNMATVMNRHQAFLERRLVAAPSVPVALKVAMA